MKFTISLLFLFLLSLLACTSTDANLNTQKIEKLLDQLIIKKSSVGIDWRMEVDTVIAVNKHFGFSNYETKRPLNQDSKFRIASITKPFTATAILQLVEKKQLSLTDRINKFFPDFPNGDNITIYHLLSHTSGIPNWWEGEMPKSEPANFPMCETPHLYLQQMKKLELFQPGEAFSYSNSGYVLLGEIIELISKMKYDKYLKKNIFQLAGMINTEMEYIEDPQDNWVKGYISKPNDAKIFSKPDIYHMPFAAGGLRSTAEDLLLFINALEMGKLVRMKTFLEMTNYAKLDNGKFVYENLYSPEGTTINFPSNIKKFGYGLGFQIVENYNKKVISHGGDIAGFNSVLIYIPHNKVKMAILSNTENGILSELQSIEQLAVSIVD